MSHLFATILGEGGPKTLWNPTILGILVVLSGLVLFAGSTYLLLATNVGARLGFMITCAALSGILVLLSSLWLVTQTPLTSPKGRTPLWLTAKCDEPAPKCAWLDKLSDSPVKAISDLARSNPTRIKAEQYQSLRSAVDAMLIKKKVVGEEKKPDQPYAAYETSDAPPITHAPVDKDKIPNKNGDETLSEYIVGGHTHLFFWHTPKYAAVEVCAPAPLASQSDPNVKPTQPGCDSTKAHKWAIFVYDWGSIRLPPLMYLLGSSAMFAISLYALHSRELAQRRIAAAGGKVAVA